MVDLIIYNLFSSDSDSDSDSDVELVDGIPNQTIDITDDDNIHDFLERCDAPPTKSKSEMGLDELPPIADLKITVPESECVELGTISGVVDTLGK